jgi:hypothetical protein
MTERKHYRDLSLDDPTPHDPAIEAKVDAMTPEQLRAVLEEAWFTNPGGHFRRRIIRKYERAGLAKVVVMPNGSERLMYGDAPELDLLIKLLDAVGGELDAPYDPNRTRADYNSEEQIS